MRIRAIREIRSMLMESESEVVVGNKSSKYGLKHLDRGRRGGENNEIHPKGKRAPCTFLASESLARTHREGAAIRLFAEKGYEGTSMKEICETAGSNRPSACPWTEYG